MNRSTGAQALRRAIGLAVAVMSLWVGGATGQPLTREGAYEPKLAEASDEGVQAIKSFRVPKGLKVTQFAAEPMLANPVAFGIDERNRFYVVETFRIHDGVPDIRDLMSWLDDDLASRTVEDRIAMYRKHLGPKLAEYGKEHDRIRLVEDADGDGEADRATVFADGFRKVEDGIAAGVLARGGDVYFTCIPHLWRLRDDNNDGKADRASALHRGYGVHLGYIGHDLHGLRFGPDGKLYFSVGDRGLDVRTSDRHLAYPDMGSVLRCNPDGSELEVFATGLRNPQELAFDEHGNLFTVDNNSDGGDKARLVYLVEGGDSGWRFGYQFIEEPNSRGPWNAEKLWHPRWKGQAAYLLPPLANLSDGPSGLAYDPGTGLPDRYRHRFFLCDFRGAPATSGVRSFAVRPRGATFELADQEQFLWGLEATDVDFGTDGAVYVSDWVQGWDKTGKGRIYRVSDPSPADPSRLLEVKRLLAEGMGRHPADELERLLAHADMRVRQEAQFALAARGPESVATLTRVAGGKSSRLARLHAIWGLGQIGRATPQALEPLLTLLEDGDPEVRAQASKVLGDARAGPAFDRLIALLKDASPRVRFFAAIGLGKLGRREAIAPLLDMLRENADGDAYLRHAGVLGLAGTRDATALLSKRDDKSAAARMGVLLALRRLGSPGVAHFLTDCEPELVLEAARAINDVPIDAALPTLAALIASPNSSEPLLRRVLNANFRLGGAANARALADFAARRDAPEALRVEALEALGDWERPSGRDRVMGLWRPLPPRPVQAAADALARVAAEIEAGAPSSVALAEARAIGKLRASAAAPILLAILGNAERAGEARAEALRALGLLGDASLPEAVRRAVRDDRDAMVRIEARRLLAQIDPPTALAVLDEALANGTLAERQAAMDLLGRLDGPQADSLLSRWLDRLLAGEVAPEIHLDLIDAAARRPSPEVKRKVARYEASLPKDDPLAPYRVALTGGDARRGEQIFLKKAEVSCLRCHKIEGYGGDVGPELTGIGARQKREYLLESLLAPSKQIAQGFETQMLATRDGQVISGIVRQDDGEALRLITPEGNLVTVPKAEIEEQKRGTSAMPDDVTRYLTKAEVRDLVEFLASSKEEPKRAE